MNEHCSCGESLEPDWQFCPSCGCPTPICEHSGIWTRAPLPDGEPVEDVIARLIKETQSEGGDGA